MYVVPPSPVTSLAVHGGGGGRFPVRRIYCVGRNYWDHGIEMGGNPEREPPFFFQKPTDAAIDVSPANATIPYPQECTKFHYEAEMVIAIGKCGQNITQENAAEYIWGYGVGVDLTRRDQQERAKEMRRPWATSKGFDFSGPVGALVPASVYGHDLKGKKIRLEVNGVEKQCSELTKMIWNPSEIVTYLSKIERLEAGDLVFTGTPAGVGPLVPGDLCETFIDGLPSCTFKVISDRGLPSEEHPELHEITTTVQQQIKCEDPRAREVLTSMVGYLHRFVRDVRPTFSELETTWGFLQNMGGFGEHPEFILGSDIFGVTELVVDMAASSAGSGSTPQTLLGPQGGKHTVRENGADANDLKAPGEKLELHGRVLDSKTGEAINGAVIDMWGPDNDGNYGTQLGEGNQDHLAGVFRANDKGAFWFRSLVPKHYSVPTSGPIGDLLRFMHRSAMRPAHIHFRITAPGYRELVTHLFIKNDPFLESDAALAVKPELIVDPVPYETDEFIGFRIDYDFKLAIDASFPS